MTTPLAAIPASLRLPGFLLSFGLMVLTGWLTSRPPGHVRFGRIVGFELAMDGSSSADVVERWSDRQREAVRASLLWDFAFIVSYVLFAALSCSFLSSGVAFRSSGLAWFGERLSWGFFVAGALDVIENIGLLRVLRAGPRAPWPQIAGLASIVKWAYLGFGLLFAVVSTCVLAGGALGRLFR